MSGRVFRDVVVIGGGQSGLAAGYFLRRQGIDFEILDANDDRAAPGRTPGTPSACSRQRR